MPLKIGFKYILQNNLKKRIKINKIAKYLFLLPGFIGVCFFVLIPYADVVRRSFFTSLSGKFVGMQNYSAVFQSMAFRLAARNTLRFVIVCIPLLLIISLMLALVFNAHKKWDKYKNFYLLPMAVPTACVVLVWQMLFCKQGFLNMWLETHVDFMGEDSSFYILVGSYLWKNFGYTLILWMAGLKTISGEILEAARVDGAGKAQCFFYVTLPNLKGNIYTIAVLSLLNSFKAFREVYLVSGSYPQDKIYLLQNVFHNWYVRLDLDKLAAGAVVIALVLGSISLLLQKLWKG